MSNYISIPKNNNVVFDSNVFTKRVNFVNPKQYLIEVITYYRPSKKSHYYISGETMIRVMGVTEICEFADNEIKCDQIINEFPLCEFQNPNTIDEIAVKIPAVNGWYCDPYQKLLVNINQGNFKYYAYIHNLWVDIKNNDNKIVEGEYYKVLFMGEWSMLKSNCLDVYAIKHPHIFVSTLCNPIENYEMFKGKFWKKDIIAYFAGEKKRFTFSPQTKSSYAMSMNQICSEDDVSEHFLYIEYSSTEHTTLISPTYELFFEIDLRNQWHLMPVKNNIFRKPECGQSEVYSSIDQKHLILVSTEVEGFNFKQTELRGFKYLVRESFVTVSNDIQSDARIIKRSFIENIQTLLLCLRKFKIKVPKVLIFLIISLI